MTVTSPLAPLAVALTLEGGGAEGAGTGDATTFYHAIGPFKAEVRPPESILVDFRRPPLRDIALFERLLLASSEPNQAEEDSKVCTLTSCSLCSSHAVCRVCWRHTSRPGGVCAQFVHRVAACLSRSVKSCGGQRMIATASCSTYLAPVMRKHAVWRRCCCALGSRHLLPFLFVAPHSQPRAQFLTHHDDARPPYRGTMTRLPEHVSPRRYFAPQFP